MSDIPLQGKIQVIQNGKLAQVSEVVKRYEYVSKINTENMQRRKWIIDVLNCVNAIEYKDFALDDMYNFVGILQENHPENHNVEAKIRQQLQILRDKGFIEFLEVVNIERLFYKEITAEKKQKMEK